MACEAQNALNIQMAGLFALAAFGLIASFFMEEYGLNIL